MQQLPDKYEPIGEFLFLDCPISCPKPKQMQYVLLFTKFGRKLYKNSTLRKSDN